MNPMNYWKIRLMFSWSQTFAKCIRNLWKSKAFIVNHNNIGNNCVELIILEALP